MSFLSSIYGKTTAALYIGSMTQTCLVVVSFLTPIDYLFDYKWSMEWQENSSRLHGYISEVSTSPPGVRLPRSAWVKLNRLRTGIGLFCSIKYKWGMASSSACECGAEEQTADHVITSCPIYRHPCGNRGLTSVNGNLVNWLTNCNKIPKIVKINY